jgi:hypothetical protein
MVKALIEFRKGKNIIMIVPKISLLTDNFYETLFSSIAFRQDNGKIILMDIITNYPKM